MGTRARQAVAQPAGSRHGRPTAAQAEIQRLRDEINRLKVEQGQPTIKANTPKQPSQDHASERERRTPNAWSKGCKTDRIPIDRAQVLAVDPARLPPDAVFKGYEDVVVQDVIFRTDNVLFHQVILEAVTMQALLAEYLPGLGPQQRKWILDATAVAASHADLEFPVVRLLVCDDAPQFALVTDELALCWVHEGRHYKELVPYVPHHRTLVEAFVQRFWTYDDQLLAYREQPRPEEAARFDGEFDALFTTVTGYDALDERMAKTHAKQGCLLMVLAHPEIPLHNNPAELGARARVRKRDVSFGPRTREGATAWDTFMTLAQTATKLGVSFYHDIHDRVSDAYQMPSLADLIAERAKVLNLGTSWDTS